MWAMQSDFLLKGILWKGRKKKSNFKVEKDLSCITNDKPSEQPTPLLWCYENATLLEAFSPQNTEQSNREKNIKLIQTNRNWRMFHKIHNWYFSKLSKSPKTRKFWEIISQEEPKETRRLMQCGTLDGILKKKKNIR